MKFQYSKALEISPYDELNELYTQLARVEFDLDQPVWMAGRYLMNRWVLERRRVKKRIQVLEAQTR